MKSRVWSVSVDSGKVVNYIAFFRTSSKGNGIKSRFRSLNTDRMCRLMRAIVNTSTAEKPSILKDGTWFSWSLLGRYFAHVREQAAIVEKATLG
jgi:hypothetical protein